MSAAGGRRGEHSAASAVDVARALELPRRAAVAFAVFIIVVETWRRSREFGDYRNWPHIFDDYVAGAFLIAAALVAARDAARGRAWLAAAWGAASFMMLGSFFGQLAEHSGPDPSGVGIACVLAFKGAMLAVCLSGLVASLRARA